MGWDHDTIVGFFDLMEDKGKPMLPTSHRRTKDLARKMFRVYPVTRIFTAGTGAGYGCLRAKNSQAALRKLDAHCKGLCSAQAITEAVGAPRLPVLDALLSPDDKASYYVRSSWARDLVDKALAEKAGPLMRAAVMEELFLY